MSLPARLLERLAPWRRAPAWRLAFSGGLDSTVLLHALTELAKTQELPAISAIHIHHGLQPAADHWPQHCAQVCAALGVPLSTVSVQVESAASLEQAARRARYRALAACLQPGELLLTAQHRDDQAETLLFRLMRGSGVRGLAAMFEMRALGPGTLLRPLLDRSRAELEDYARIHGLHWVEDPSNDDTGYDRNYLRRQVMPLLRRRWPRIDTVLARSAGHFAEAQMLLDELAEMDLQRAAITPLFGWLDVPSLSLEVLRALSPSRQRNALRAWLAPLSRLPDSAHWAGWQALCDARQDAVPVWRLADGELRRADGRIWWLSGDWLQVPQQFSGRSCQSGSIVLPGNGHLEVGTLPEGDWHIAYRQGGEKLHVRKRGQRDLKRLLQEWKVPEFMRQRLPLLFDGDELVAVANFHEPLGHFRWFPPLMRFELVERLA